MSVPCAPVVVDEHWMQTHSGFDLSAAETKSHYSVHYGCGYIYMKTRERAFRGLHLPPRVRSMPLINSGLTLLKKIEKMKFERIYKIT